MTGSNHLMFMTEYTPSTEILVESVADGSVFIKGPFISYKRNRNGRIYDRETVILPEIMRYNQEKIQTKRAWGELEHPESTQINPDRVSHLVVALQDVNEYAIGKAKVLDTPCGKVAKELLKEGSVGISTRGIGSVDKNGKVTEFKLICPDIVLNPSGIECFVQMVNEKFDFFVESGIIRQIPKKQLDAMSAVNYRLTVLNAFKGAFNVLKDKR